MLILQDALSRRKSIDRLKERIEELRSAMEIGQRHLDAAPANKTYRNKLEEDMCKLDELERQLVGDTAALEETRREADAVLEAIDAPERYREVVRLRYCEGLPWWQVAENTNYSMRQCKRIGPVIIEKMSRNVTF